MVTLREREIRDAIVDFDNSVKHQIDWARLDAECRKSGQTGKKPWTGSFALPEIGQRIIVWPGCYVGTVADYGIARVGDVFERAVWVKLAEYEYIKLTGRYCMELTEKEQAIIDKRNEQFRKRLVAAGKKVERQRKERRRKQVVGSHLLDEMLAIVEEMGLKLDEKSSFYKITGVARGKRVYVSIKGGRVDLSGFCVDHDAVRPISEQEARDRHLGKVRGQLDFSKGDELVISAYRKSLSRLNE